jgi:hypothetical protein
MTIEEIIKAYRNEENDKSETKKKKLFEMKKSNQ